MIVRRAPGRPSGVPGPSNARGFTLLEVIVALAIAAISLAAISASHTSSVIHSAKVYRMGTAAMLMRGLVLDIEEEYHVEGFPDNDLFGRDCDVPRPFDKAFECEFDLEGMEFAEGELQSMASGALEGLMGGGDMSGLMGGGKSPQDKLSAFQNSFDPALLPAMAMLFGPGGEELLSMCSINLANIMMSVGGITQFFPQIVQKAAEQTRKLTVRVTWKEGFRNERELRIETFIVSFPEEQEELLKLLGRADEAGMLDGPEEGPTAPGASGRRAPGGGR